MGKRGRKPNPFKEMSLVEIRLLQFKISTELRSRRMKSVLSMLAKKKDKTFRMKHMELNLMQAIERQKIDQIDELLEVFEIILDLE